MTYRILQAQQLALEGQIDAAKRVRARLYIEAASAALGSPVDLVGAVEYFRTHPRTEEMVTADAQCLTLQGQYDATHDAMRVLLQGGA